MPTIQPEIPEILGGNAENGTEVVGKKFPKIFVYLKRLSYFPDIFENVDPFVTRISQNPNMTFLYVLLKTP